MTLQKTLARSAARRAFTLMEMLIVVAIVVVLAGVGTFYLLPQLEKSKEDAAHLRAKEIEKALTAYFTDRGTYPGTLMELAKPSDGGKAYLPEEALIDPWGNAFTFDPAGQHFDGNRPDVWTEHGGVTIGNWRMKK
jgi:general secretion pathway protein G